MGNNKERAIKKTKEYPIPISPPKPLPRIHKLFDSYSITHYSEQYRSPDPPHTKYSTYHITIICYYKKELVGYKAEPVGTICFYDLEKIPPNSADPARYYTKEGEIDYLPRLNFHVSRFNDIINTIRYEKPLELFLDLNNMEGAISTPVTISEPVGEQE